MNASEPINFKKLSLSRRDAEARARGRGLSPVPPTPPIDQPPPAPHRNDNPTAAPAVVDIPQDQGEGGHPPTVSDLLWLQLGVLDVVFYFDFTF